MPLLIAAAALAALAVLGALALGWSIDRGAGFEDVVRLSLYLGVFVLAALLMRPGHGPPVLAGIAAGLVVVSLIALASRLLGIGAGDAELVAATPAFAGRLSYPIGYWNALGAMAAMAIPVLIWLESATGSRVGRGLALAAIPPVLLTAFMTSSRGALIAAAIGATIAIAAAGSRPRRRRPRASPPESSTRPGDRRVVPRRRSVSRWQWASSSPWSRARLWSRGPPRSGSAGCGCATS